MPSGSFELRQALQPILGHSAHYHQFECLSERGWGGGRGKGVLCGAMMMYDEVLCSMMRYDEVLCNTMRYYEAL